MAKKKQKTTARRAPARRKSRAQERMPAGLGTLFAGLLLIVLAFLGARNAYFNKKEPVPIVSKLISQFFR